jgi:predicted O-linked N-acetylglucosamine transferase (SPINDLY family)
MHETIFLSSVQQATDGELGLTNLIHAAGQLAQAGQPKLALQLYKIWISFNREHPQVFVGQFNAAVLATDLGDTAVAMDLLRDAILRNEDFLPAYINLGGLLERAGQREKGLELWKAALGKLTAVTNAGLTWKAATLKQIARALGEMQDGEGAQAALRECLMLDPKEREVMEQYLSIRLSQCQWPVIAPFDNVDATTQVGGIHPLSMCAFTDDPLLQLASAARYSTVIVDETADLSKSDRRDAPIETNRRLRIGYISSDLRDHAIGYLMAELFEVHDRERVEVFAYYCGRPSSEGLNTRIKAAIEHWVDIREMRDDEAAARIAADGIDILIDVNGHTRDARTGVFARRPAPIQVNWLGYPGTMGSPYHHYIIADDWIIPPEAEAYYSEKVLRLPCYQSNDRKRVVADVPQNRADHGLPEEGAVFCCFNGTQKITPFVFDRWVRILKQTPGSVLWLLESTPKANTNLKIAAEAAGLDPARLVFAPKMANPFHLARYTLADLFLDTAPYGAHTTCSDALWMGVPVLTLGGRCFASRVCGSLVRAAGLPEMICNSDEEYVRRAVEYGRDLAKLEPLKARLKEGRDSCTLFDTDLLATKLEDLFVEMAQAHRRGLTPEPDLRNLETYFQLGVQLDRQGQELLGHPDYHGLYLERLAARHRTRAIPADDRLWTPEAIAVATGRGEDAAPLRRAVG